MGVASPLRNHSWPGAYHALWPKSDVLYEKYFMSFFQGKESIALNPKNKGFIIGGLSHWINPLTGKFSLHTILKVFLQKIYNFFSQYFVKFL